MSSGHAQPALPKRAGTAMNIFAIIAQNRAFDNRFLGKTQRRAGKLAFRLISDGQKILGGLDRRREIIGKKTRK